MEYALHQIARNFAPDIWDVPEPPKKLFIQGSQQALELLHQLPEKGLAVVGTRNPQALSQAFLQKKLLELSGSDLIIVSGLARGIDTVAHRSALQAGLPTIAVLGTGLDINYPHENKNLRQEILRANGLLVSEYPHGAPALGHHFLKRNRLIAGWAKATWVVEASFRSGALNTARWAREMERTCFTLPCFPGDISYVGNQSLLDRDQALPFWGIHSLGAAWIEFAASFKVKQKQKSQLAPDKFSKEKWMMLARHVSILTYRKGGAQVQELLDWAASQGWDTETFFTAMQTAIQQKLIIDHSGAMISSQY